MYCIFKYTVNVRHNVFGLSDHRYVASAFAQKKTYRIADLHTTPGRPQKRENDMPSTVHVMSMAHHSSNEGCRSCLSDTTHSQKTTKQVVRLRF